MILSTHLKLVGIRSSTIRLYRRALIEFLSWRKSSGYTGCRNYADLDLQLADYIAFLYAKGDPLYRAANALSGLKKFVPQTRRSLEVSAAYYSNWCKVTKRARALPLAPQWAKAFVSYAYLTRQPEMGLLVLTGFLGLFRVGDLLSLECGQLLPVASNCLYVSFEESKGAQRKGAPERVRLQDLNLIRILSARKSRRSPQDKVFAGSYASVAAFLRQAGEFFELPSARLTSHCLRRGGATWHFDQYQSFDRTAEHGRWTSVRTCRMYIEQSSTELAKVAQGERGKERVKLALNGFSKAMEALA